MNAIKEFLKPNWWKVSFLLLALIFLFNPVLFSEAQINLGDDQNFDQNGHGIKKIIIVAPPDVFALPESETTDFIRVCTLGEALNIVLDVAGKNKVDFQEPIVDMCDNETMENLDQYIQLDKVGEVTVDSDSLSYLKNKSAVITMRNLPFEEEPDVEVDGKTATDQDIENKNWDQPSKTLTFKAKHFTTYKAVSRAVEPSGTKDSFAPTDTENQIPSAYDYRTIFPKDVYTFGLVDALKISVIIGLILIAIVIGYFIRRRKK